jgi:hypothetical protein
MKQLLTGVSLLSFLIFSLYAFANNNYLLAVITALFYVVDPLYYVTTSTYAARTIPDEMRGRVSSLARLIVLGAHSFGFFITGILLQYLGSKWTIGVFSGLLFFLFLATLLSRKFAQVDSAIEGSATALSERGSHPTSTRIDLF